jgi:hypothetical protein
MSRQIYRCFYHLAIFLAAAPLLIVNSIAYGSEYEALSGKLIVGRCHMENCWWFSIEGTEKMGEAKVGELFAISTKNWSTYCKDSNENRCDRKKFDGADISFILCSKTHPSWITNINDEGNSNEWTVEQLGPGSMDASSGAGFGVHVIYWAACHKLEVSDPFDPKLGQKFGYPTALPRYFEDKSQKRISNPFEVLGWD